MKRGGSLRWLSASRCVKKELSGAKAWLFRAQGRYFWEKLFLLPASFFPPEATAFFCCRVCKGFCGVFFFPSSLHSHSALSVECGENPSSQYVSRRVKGKGKVNNAC